MQIKKLINKILISSLIAISLLINYPINSNAECDELYLGGFPAGFILNTKTVEVVGLCEIITENGAICPAKDCGLAIGDKIERINEREINSTEDLNVAINSEYKSYSLYYDRNGVECSTQISPAIDSASGQKRLGLLVKDSVNGIGTVTYINKTNNTYASLGHPVIDNNSKLVEINGGSIYGCVIYDIKRGYRGNPGELHGAFENYNILGTATKNCNSGIYGNISQEFDCSNLAKIQPMNMSEVKIGRAEIYSTIGGDIPKKYDISIIKVDEFNKDNRNFVIRVDDKKLINKSGGIVQGMSGSPIVQNGKLVGAVTHVFVNDPTRGYGISIEKMLEHN